MATLNYPSFLCYMLLLMVLSNAFISGGREEDGEAALVSKCATLDACNGKTANPCCCNSIKIGINKQKCAAVCGQLKRIGAAGLIAQCASNGCASCGLCAKSANCA